MFRKLLACFVASMLFLSLVYAESDPWNALEGISPGQKIQIVQTDLKSFEGEFTSYDQRSISLQQKGKHVNLSREMVLRVSLRGPSKRKRNVLLGLAIGAGAGLALGIASSSSDSSWEIVSDEVVTASLIAIGAGGGALLGLAFPSHEYRTVYRAKTSFEGARTSLAQKNVAE